MDVTEIIKAARRPERTHPLCLRGDLVAEWEKLDRQRVDAEKNAPADSLAGSPALPIARQMEALQAQMAESTVTFRLRGLPRNAYRDLIEAHPPRRDDVGDVMMADRGWGFDTRAFFPALIRATVVEPALDDAVMTELLDETLTAHQFEELLNIALDVNAGKVDIPFSPAASKLIASSATE
jgi:hypothetical protein